MTPRELADKLAVICFEVPEKYPKVEQFREAIISLLTEALAEAGKDAVRCMRVTDVSEARAAAYEEGLKHGIDDPKWHELVSIVRKQTYEECAKIVENIATWSETPLARVDIAKTIRRRAGEIK